uniref:Tetratricopeptide repeat protein 39B n=1 Tax=Ascaris suum TaxID=6253 RepID=F1L255_ASCSU
MSPSVELLDSISEAQIAMNLFLNNKFQMAEDRMATQAQKSMYHALGYSAVVFIKATMTCDRQDVERAMRISKDAAAVIDAYRAKFSISDSFYRLSGQMRTLTDQELHAELCYAESLLFCSILTFFHDESLSSFVRGALKIRACYQSYRECERLLKSKIWAGRDERIKAQFESGTHLGVGTFNLLLSTLPTKILRLLEVVGFSGDKDIGMCELHECISMSGTLRATLCSLVLLSWHLIAVFLVGAANPDIDICEKLLAPLNNSYPQGAIVLFFRARLNIVIGRIEHGIYSFNRSIDAQHVYRQFHHVCFWELLFAYSYLRQWARAANYAKRLLDESRWSKCVYTYTLAILINADENVPRRAETVEHLLKKVPDLRVRIAGKSLPVEKFCALKANRFLKTGSLLLAHYEFLYFWNGFTIMAANTKLIEPILEDIDATWERFHKENADHDEKCLYLLMRGVCLRLLRNFFQAEQCFNEIVANEGELEDHSYLVPYAVFELAQLRADERREDDAKQLLEKARSYKGYPLETRLHFRIHSRSEALGARTPLPH